MNTTKVLPTNVSNFPSVLLSFAMIFTVVVLIGLSLSSYFLNAELDVIVEKHLKASSLIGDIALEDEVLTTSARMYASTKDKKWAERYSQFDKKQTTSINTLLLISGSETLRHAVQEADTLVQSLAAVERETFILTDQGKSVEAGALLNNQPYLSLKSKYKELMDQYVVVINQELEADIQHINMIGYVTFFAIAINLILLLSTWFFTYKSIFSWRSELETKIQSELHYKKEIESARHFLKEVLLINKMSDQLQTCQAPIEAYLIVSHAAKQLFPSLSGGLCICQQGTNDIETVQTWGDYQCLKPTFSADDCWSLREGHPYIINENVHRVVCQHFQPLPPSNSICVPLIMPSGTIGILELNAPHNGDITDHQQQLAITFSEVLRLSLGNILLREALSEQVTQDALTGLLNRRSLDKALPLMIKRAMRSKAQLCVAMLDIDFFKSINDTYGHEAGDEVLKMVGKLLKNNFREYDTAYRYGGEEFLLVMESSLKDALPRLQQMSQDIKSTKVKFQNAVLPAVNMSIGVAEVPTHAVAPDEVIRLADEALYRAKSAGRDRIEVARG